MKLNVVFLGCTQGYGYTFSACNTKIEFMSRGLTELGNTCYIHNGLVGKTIYPNLNINILRVLDILWIILNMEMFILAHFVIIIY